VSSLIVQRLAFQACSESRTARTLFASFGFHALFALSAFLEELQ